MANIDISKNDRGYVRLTKRSGGCDSGVEPASRYREVAGLISLDREGDGRGGGGTLYDIRM